MEKEIKELEELTTNLEEKINYFEELKKELNLLYTRCWLCGSSKCITNHSIVGEHKQPYIPLCKECHKMIENFKLAIKVMEEKEPLTINNFKVILNSINGQWENKK